MLGTCSLAHAGVPRVAPLPKATRGPVKWAGNPRSSKGNRSYRALGGYWGKKPRDDLGSQRGQTFSRAIHRDSVTAGR
jgi:hypothetical protein